MFKKLSLFFFFFFSIISVYVIFLPKILSSIGYSALEIGIIFSCSPLARFILPFVFRKYFTMSKNIFYFALVGMVLTGLFFYVSVNNFWLFLIANVCFGVFVGIVIPYVESYSLKVLQRQRYGKARLFGSLGFIVLSLILAQNLQNPLVGLDFLFATMFITAIFGFLIVARNDDFKSAHKTSNISLWAHKRFWISLFLLQVSFGGFYNFFTIYESAQGISLQMISWMWTFGVCCEILFFYFQAPVLKTFEMPRLMSFAFFVTFIRWMILYLYPDVVGFIFLSQSFHAISFALLHSAAFSHLHVIYKNNPLASQFYYGISFGLGGFVGSIIAGYLYGEYLFLVCAFIALLAFAVYGKGEAHTACKPHKF